MHRFVHPTSRVLLVIVLAAVTYLSLSSSPPAAPGRLDKVWHLLSYAALGFLLVLSFSKGPISLPRVLLLAVIVVAYGVAIEFAQQWTGRQFEVADMLADAAGAAAGTAAGMLVRRLLAGGRPG